MIFEQTHIPGVIVVRTAPERDSRGDFGRLWCAAEFAAAGCPFHPAQISASRNITRHTLRGLHWQAAPNEETKLVRAAAGRIFDVTVDMRVGSPTLHQSMAIELDSAEQTAVLIPPGCAHGFLTLTDATEVIYLIDSRHSPSSGCGVRYDDPTLRLEWPASPTVITQRDQTWPLL